MPLSKNLQKLKVLSATIDEAYDHLDAFFELSPDLLVIADPRGYFIRVNPAWKKELGYSYEELTGRPFFHFIYHEDIEKTVEEVSNMPEVSRFQNRYQAKDGSIISLDWHSIERNGYIYGIARVVDRQPPE